MKQSDAIEREGMRVKAEYERRADEVPSDLYAPWQPGEILMTSERKRRAAEILNSIGKFPRSGDRCLEIGYGKLGWLADLISWGIREADLYGIELDATRAAVAQKALPNASLMIGDAAQLPWENDYFDLVVASTVFSSILDRDVRKLIADEITRVLPAGGTILLYDIAVNNPRNKNLLRLERSELGELFPEYDRHCRSVTLAPPLARKVAKYSWPLAVLLSSLPFLRTHFVAILVKQ